MASVTLRKGREGLRRRAASCTASICEIADGEFVVLVGPSGCGKSTLLRMIAGLEEVSGGEIRIGERLVNDVAPKDRDIAMVFQSYALYPHMDVSSNMGFSLLLKKAEKVDDRDAGRRRRQAARAGHLPRAAAAPALRRPAPARRHGPRHRARSEGVSFRRAAVQPRCQAARAYARRDQGAAPAAQDHLGLCHPRPDRGDDHGRPHRRHA